MKKATVKPAEMLFPGFSTQLSVYSFDTKPHADSPMIRPHLPTILSPVAPELLQASMNQAKANPPIAGTRYFV